MRYLGPSQINTNYQNSSTEKKLEIMEAAFTIKDIHPEYSRTDCIALAMGCNICISGSGFYETNEDL